MAKPKTLREVSRMSSTQLFFSSFTSEAQEEREFEEYLRGPTYDDVFPPSDSRESTPVPEDGSQPPWRSSGSSEPFPFDRYSSPPPRGVSVFQSFWDRLGSASKVQPVKEVDPDSDDDDLPSIELPDDLGDLIPDFTCNEAPAVRPSELVKKRKGGRIGKLAPHKTRRRINSLMRKAAKASAAASEPAGPMASGSTYRLIDPQMLADVERFDLDEYFEYPEDDEGACRLL